ncbi:hypothetical protein [Salinicola rhizosphaerae]|uniref:Lipoprotein n=1 Tax=Salinicola rhizosphaerae TaxID=1443141 RepID=A0ABQ3DRF8_9GAMM|nr:hypothetical protein [Salinicola rhizosphaerae]GHB13063.1 hypothetical protein GCM10009038_08940 [Salinicola rhizosphaerae]
MKILKLTALFLLSILIVSTSGCVTVTGEMNPEKSSYESESKATPDNKLFQNVRINQVEGFVGTSAFALAGKTSPNLTNETARTAVENTLKTANLFNDKGSYLLDIKVVEDGSRGYWAVGDPGYRTTEINYKLVSDSQTLYDKDIETEGRSDGMFAYYLIEREAAEQAMRRNLKELVDDLLAID